MNSKMVKDGGVRRSAFTVDGDFEFGSRVGMIGSDSDPVRSTKRLHPAPDAIHLMAMPKVCILEK